MLDEYKTLTGTHIVDNLSESLGLETWMVVILIAAGAVLLISTAIGVTFILTKRHLSLKKIKETSNDNINLEDIFGEKAIKPEEPGHEYTAEKPNASRDIEEPNVPQEDNNKEGNGDDKVI